MAASALILEELSGKRRRLELQGAGLPFIGASWGSTTTLATQWNPGNPEATQHVLGPQELPSRWDGEWNTNRLLRSPCQLSEGGGASSAIVYPATLMAVLEDLSRGGQALRVTWSNEKTVTPTQGEPFVQALKIVREGRIEECDFKIARQDDIKWTASFVWFKRGTATQRPVADRQENLLATLRRAMVAANDAAATVAIGNLLANSARVPFASPFSLGQLEALVDAPMAIVDSFARFAQSVTHDMKELGDLVLKVRALPAALLGRAIDVANNAVAVSNQFVDELSRAGPETLTARQKVSNLVKAASYYGAAQRQADLVAGANAELVQRLNQRRTTQTYATSSSARRTAVRPQEVVAIHMPRQGETMASIARKYYGTTDLAGPLARANGLPAATITPPRRAIVIPSKEVLETSDRI